MKKRQSVIVGGRKFKRISTAYSWRSAQTVARQERLKMNATVVIRKDPDGKSYGVFNRPQPMELMLQRDVTKRTKVERNDSSLSWGRSESRVKINGLHYATLNVLYQVASHKMDYTYNHLTSFYVKRKGLGREGKRSFYNSFAGQHRTKRAAWKRLRQVQRSFERHMRAGRSIRSWRPPKR